jgi:hypothetical protein
LLLVREYNKLSLQLGSSSSLNTNPDADIEGINGCHHYRTEEKLDSLKLKSRLASNLASACIRNNTKHQANTANILHQQQPINATMSSHQHHPPSSSKKPSLPKFEPLPPTNFLNRLINRLLAPLFYLLFTIITAIIVVPVYVMIDNFKNGRNKNGGRRVPKDESGRGHQRDGTTGGKASGWLREYSRSAKDLEGKVK